MDKDEIFDFQIEADKLLLACRFLADLDLGAITQAVNRADTIGPIIDPTAYQRALHNGGMHAAGRLADLAKPLVATFNEIQNDIDA
jgi:hypothetical protein